MLSGTQRWILRFSPSGHWDTAELRKQIPMIEGCTREVASASISRSIRRLISRGYVVRVARERWSDHGLYQYQTIKRYER